VKHFVGASKPAIPKQKIKNILIMSTTKTKPTPNGATDAAASKQTPEYRINPEMEAKIDKHIADNPNNWAYIQAMPRDRLERTVVLNEVRQVDRRQRIQEGVMQDIKNDPKIRAAYDVILKDVPEEQRGDVIMGMEREKWLAKQPKTQTQTQSRKEAVGVGV
jgi:hypothetical protein